ncbi:MAG: TraR/DksA family transcriptional regulator [Thermomicrobiales bacterium]|nr:TraR/DksA family transcriptional regulator [Thermomicrobiales bacterium]
MNDQQLAELRGLLTAKLAEIDENVTSLKEESREVAEDQGDEAGFLAEDGSSLAEAERLDVFSGNLNQMRARILNALDRMEDGTYGKCLRCGKHIPIDRLRAIPYAEYDVACQEIIDREQALRAGTA